VHDVEVSACVAIDCHERKARLWFQDGSLSLGRDYLHSDKLHAMMHTDSTSVYITEMLLVVMLL
jgi:hypothetical protein